ncbi:MAG: radical SAM protein [Tepidisphaeraceae bacterium]|jgi:organic radical activating enzyme
MSSKQVLYHVTVLSNFARGFDKYTRRYSKAGITESTHPNRFFLLRREELDIGIQKGTALMGKLDLSGNKLIALETEVETSALQRNTSNGRGQFINSAHIVLTGVHAVERRANRMEELAALSFEDATAFSLRLLNPKLAPFSRIRPRAISFLPVALACQAKCPFCFSKASVSSDQSPAKPDWDLINEWLGRARKRGAERAVITGGEPTLLHNPALTQLISACAHKFAKVVLITNGHVFATAPAPEQIERLQTLYDAGLRVLAVSRHHHQSVQNQRLMNLNTPAEVLIRTWREHRGLWPDLRLRLICVLQKSGVDNEEALADYLCWASNQGVEEVCFKELYISTSAESIYHDRSANDWSRLHQVPLSLVGEFTERHGFVVESSLPWGAPVYWGHWRGRPLRIAAYTEPSLFWERARGIARSWNIMADGRCLVSLEDRSSEINLTEMA